MKRGLSQALAAVAALAVSIVPATAGADSQPSTHVDSVSATVGGNVVAVSGTASFVATPLLVSEDGTGDATPANIGADINVATVTRPVGTNNLVFKWTISDQLPAPVVTAPNLTYLWPLAVNGEDSGFFLMGGRAGGFPSASTNPVLSLMQSGADGFSNVARLSGTVGGGEVSWTLPLSRIGAKTGDVITAGGGSPAGSWNGMVEVVYAIVNYDAFAPEDFTVPGATVKMGIAPAGTPESAVALTESATSVNAATGAFSGTFPKPAPGSYIVVTQACYSANNCGTSSTTITV